MSWVGSDARNANITGKRVFVPYIDGQDMRMIEAASLSEVESFSSNRWGIPEPTSIEGRADGKASQFALV